mgnify:CR=1 FL=1
MIRAELHLEALLRLPARTHHHAGVVDEQVELFEAGVHALRKLAHRLQVGQVDELDLHTLVAALVHDSLGRLLRLFRVPTRQYDPGASFGKVKRRLVADPGVAARNYGHFAVQSFRAPAHAARKVHPIQKVAQWNLKKQKFRYKIAES